MIMIVRFSSFTSDLQRLPAVVRSSTSTSTSTTSSKWTTFSCFAFLFSFESFCHIFHFLGNFLIRFTHNFYQFSGSAPILTSHETQCDSCSSCSACSANSVDIFFNVTRKIVVDNMSDVDYINATGS